MDQEIRNRLRNVVTQCRTSMEKDIRSSLEGRFRIYETDGQVIADPNAPMGHLEDDNERNARVEILDYLNHIKARGFDPKDALDQLVREIAFTHLNRLCAYKMMEAREVYIGGQKFREAVSRGVNSNGVKFYLADHPEEERLFNTGHQDLAYRHFLDWLGDFLSDEIGVLFNPNDPANRLYPKQTTLDEVLDLLNRGQIKPEETELREAWPKIWSQDETIGWVYQYFTPKELRDQARKESAAPRNSYELAFRNQFFTPRYVVEFLTDNTLGRIWYEMRKGDTRLKDQCRYMVRRPNEVFLPDGEQPPQGSSERRDDLPQEELLKLAVHIPHRSKKDPRELRILDPACGSGHFLLYCFELLLAIYEEAYADPDLGPAFNDKPLDEFRREIPGLILSHNLHGIDIDLRCSQIAALALWLRCQKAYQEMGLKKDRPKITRSNFVCAEPMPGEAQMLKEFVAQLEPRLLGQLVGVIFEKMKWAGEVGSLLTIEDQIRDAVAYARQQWLAGPVALQGKLFDEGTLVAAMAQQRRFDFSGITNAQFFEKAEERVIEAVRSYAETAQNGQRLQRLLFADDAERGFAFVDLCYKRYDVVLMNPPFGNPSLKAEDYLHNAYPNARYEVYGQFLQRALEWSDGYVGALTSRGFLYLANYQSIREAVLPYLSHFLDLGPGVLDDAFVEVCASVFTVFRCDRVVCLDSRPGTIHSGSGENLLLPSLRLFSKRYIECLDNAPFCYDTDQTLLALFQSGYTLDKALGGLARVGLATGDNERFVRCHWEVPTSSINGRWRWHAKGGEYLPFKSDVHLLVDWADNGKPIEDAFVGARIHKVDVYFRPGVTYSIRSLKGLTFRPLPANCICSHKGPVLISPGNEFALLALTNSALFKHLVKIQSAFGAYEIGTVQRVPLPMPFENYEDRLTRLGEEIGNLYVGISCLDETDIHFFWPDMLSSARTFEEMRESVEDWLSDSRQKVDKLLRTLDGVVCEAYHIEPSVFPPNDYPMMEEVFAAHSGKEGVPRAALSFAVGCVFGRWDIRFATGARRRELFGIFEALPSASSIALKGTGDNSTSYPLRIDCGGIIPDDPEHKDDIVHRAREACEVIWGDRAGVLETEACESLGVRGLRDYFRKQGKGGFWDDHISRYSKSRRKAPIYWLLQSSKRNYAVWLYYHRLDKDLLFKALVNYVEPKIRLEVSRLESLQGQKQTAGSTKEAKRLAKQIEVQEDFLSELRDFEDKVRRAANLHLEPDLNDGVVLNIAPLHECVPWKEAKNYWEELLKGKYEWSSIGKQLRQKGLVK